MSSDPGETTLTGWRAGTSTLAASLLAVAVLVVPLGWLPVSQRFFLAKGLVLAGLSAAALMLAWRPGAPRPWPVLVPAALLLVCVARTSGSDRFAAEVGLLLLAAPLLTWIALALDGRRFVVERLLDLALLPAAVLATWLAVTGRHGASAPWPLTPLGSPNRAAAYLAICLPWALRPGRGLGRVVRLVLAAALMLGLVRAGSRGAWLAAGLASVVVVLGTRRAGERVGWPAGLALTLGVAAALSWPGGAQPVTSRLAETGSVQVRRLIWGATLRLIGERPWIGHGLGQFPVEYPRVRPDAELRLSLPGRLPRTPHADPLQLAFELGLPATLALLGWLLWLLAGAWRERTATAAAVVAMGVAFAVHGGVSALATSPGVSQLVALAAAWLVLRGGPGRMPVGMLRALGWLGVALLVARQPIALLRADYHAARAERLAVDRADAADHAISEARAASAGHPRALFLEAQLLGRAGRHADAARRYETYLEARPHSLAGWTNLGLAQFAAGEVDAARASWSRAARQSPAYRPARRNLGLLAARERRWADAVRELTVVVERRDTPQDRFLLAVARLATGESAGLDDLRTSLAGGHRVSAADVDRLVAALPADADAITPVAVALHDAGQLEASLACLRRALDLAPTRVDVRFALGVALIDARQAIEALKQLTRALRAGYQPTDADRTRPRSGPLVRQLERGLRRR